MDFFEIRIYTENYPPDFIVGLLSDLPFNGFEEGIEMLLAYLPVTGKRDELEARLNTRLPENIQYDIYIIKDQNWNAIWESNYKPITVHDFCCIRASFHEPDPGVIYDIVIDPKMAFGTGHHETTYLMIEAIQDLDLRSSSVLDFGCGTGVLAILAAKMGANRVIAIDNDYNAYQNCMSNSIENSIENIECKHSELKPGMFDRFDFILANINYNVLKNQVSKIANYLLPGGILLISGILKKDKDYLIEVYARVGLQFSFSRAKNEWALLAFTRS